MTTTQEFKIITETPRDTTIITAPDSAQVKILIQCAEKDKLLIKQLETTQGNNININIKETRQSDSTYLLTVDCKTDSLLLEIKLRDKIIETQKHSTEVISKYREPPWYSVALQALGIIFLILIAYIIYKHFRP